MSMLSFMNIWDFPGDLYYFMFYLYLIDLHLDLESTDFQLLFLHFLGFEIFLFSP